MPSANERCLNSVSGTNELPPRRSSRPLDRDEGAERDQAGWLPSNLPPTPADQRTPLGSSYAKRIRGNPVFGRLQRVPGDRGTKEETMGTNEQAKHPKTALSLNLVVVALFVVKFIVRAAQDSRQATVLGFVLTLIALAVLSASGWLGGKLAYTYGVRVADETTQSKGFTA
jgi:hypothetical protein